MDGAWVPQFRRLRRRGWMYTYVIIGSGIPVSGKAFRRRFLPAIWGTGWNWVVLLWLALVVESGPAFRGAVLLAGAAPASVSELESSSTVLVGVELCSWVVMFLFFFLAGEEVGVAIWGCVGLVECDGGSCVAVSWVSSSSSSSRREK